MTSSKVPASANSAKKISTISTNLTLTSFSLPPSPVLNVSQRWFLRDSNWFANLPDSAKKITYFYEKEGGQTPDLILVMTPNFIADSLKQTGPVDLPLYNAHLDSDNFVELIQAISTQSDNSPVNSPKQILADFVPVFLQKLQALPKEQWQTLAQTLWQNLQNKQIALYSRDSDTEDRLKAFNWAGDLKNTDRDYLDVISANLSGSKTDLSIDQQLSLRSTIGEDGSITDELTITRTNKQPALHDTSNDSFLRIFVPSGSVLLSNLGFDYKNLDDLKNSSYKVDPDVYAWEKNSVKDVISGTIIGQESGKTYFGNWLKLDGGQTRTIKLVYRLPFKLGAVDHFSLLLQKQLGSVDQNFSYDLKFAGRSLLWKNFDPQTLGTGQLQTAFSLDKDYLLGEVLSRP